MTTTNQQLLTAYSEHCKSLRTIAVHAYAQTKPLKNGRSDKKSK